MMQFPCQPDNGCASSATSSGLLPAPVTLAVKSGKRRGEPLTGWRQELPGNKGCVLLDVGTQRDFFEQGGRCYRRARSRAAARSVRALFRWVMANGTPVISILFRLRRSRFGGSFYCEEGSAGEQKLGGTALQRRINFGLRNTTDLPPNLFSHCQQAIFETRHTDILSHSRVERLITELPPCTFILCGADLSEGIAQAAIGLRARGLHVVVARDAVVARDDGLAIAPCYRMRAKGVVFSETKEITASGCLVSAAAEARDLSYGVRWAMPGNSGQDHECRRR